MSKMISGIINDLKSFGSYRRFMEYWMFVKYRKPRRFEKLHIAIRSRYDYAKWVMAIIYCGIVGHRYDDEGECDPESGYESHTCSRCWYSWDCYHG